MAKLDGVSKELYPGEAEGVFRSMERNRKAAERTNFRITNGVSSPVPEPATYAALFGVLALAFAAWRGRKA